MARRTLGLGAPDPEAYRGQNNEPPSAVCCVLPDELELFCWAWPLLPPAWFLSVRSVCLSICQCVGLLTILTLAHESRQTDREVVVITSALRLL